jgi:predicted secreted protein
MKTLLKITAIVILNSILVTPMKANNGTEASTEKQIQKQLNVNCVRLNAEEQTKVDVVFTTNEEGKVNLVIAKTENEDIKKEIEKNFSKLVLPNVKPNVCYGVTLNIKAK